MWVTAAGVVDIVVGILFLATSISSTGKMRVGVTILGLGIFILGLVTLILSVL